MKVVSKPSSAFTDEEINDVFVTALEGGIDHFVNEFIEYKPSATHAVIRVDREVFTITADTIRLGIDRLAKSDLWWHYADLLKETYDAETADVIVQLALFGDVERA